MARREPSAEALAAAAAADGGGRGNWRAAAHALYSGPLRGEDDNAPGPGVVLYLLPMGAGQGKGGSTRGWGTPLHSFWCCHGSSVESFAKLADSIFFHRWGVLDKPSQAVHPPSSCHDAAARELQEKSQEHDCTSQPSACTPYLHVHLFPVIAWLMQA